MSEFYTTSFQPETGKVVELPTDIKRVTTDRIGSPQIGYGNLHVGIIGSGDLTEYVVLSDDNGEIDLPSGSQFLTIDAAADKSYFAVPKSEY